MFSMYSLLFYNMALNCEKVVRVAVRCHSHSAAYLTMFVHVLIVYFIVVFVTVREPCIGVM